MTVALVRKLTIPTERLPLVGKVSLVPTFADRGCHVVSMTDPLRPYSLVSRPDMNSNCLNITAFRDVKPCSKMVVTVPVLKTAFCPEDGGSSIRLHNMTSLSLCLSD
jgi:hypothetical protein